MQVDCVPQDFQESVCIKYDTVGCLKLKSLSHSLARKQFPKRKLESRSDGEEAKQEEKEVDERQESKRARVEVSPGQTGEIR